MMQSRRAGKAAQKRVAAMHEVPVSATEKAYTVIREAILTNALRSGEPVPVERFVRELGLSRTPVREAILRLEREGLIEVRPRMGTFVSHLDLRQIHEMYELRRLLEGHAVKLAALRAPVEVVAGLRKELEALRTDGPDVDCRALSEIGARLHTLILDHCGNLTLAAMLRSLHHHFVRFRSVSLTIPEKVISSHREHLSILRAMEARHPEQAQSLIHKHFDNAAKLLLENLLSAPPEPGRGRITVAGAAR